MTVLGLRLWGPKAAALLLCVYAAGYALLVLYFVFVAVETLGAFVWFLGVLALAATPFMALIHLERATTPDSTAPMRPVLMTIVMAAPTLFWGYAMISGGARGFPSGIGDAIWVFGLVAVPAFLSLWLFVAFALLASRKRPTAD